MHSHRLYGAFFFVVSVIQSKGKEQALWIGFGYAAIYCFAFVLLPIVRRSPLSRLLGTSFERAVKFHRWMGVLCFVFVTIHGAGMISVFGGDVLEWGDNGDNDINYLAGVISWIALFVLVVSSLSIVRRRFWEVCSLPFFSLLLYGFLPFLCRKALLCCFGLPPFPFLVVVSFCCCFIVRSFLCSISSPSRSW